MSEYVSNQQQNSAEEEQTIQLSDIWALVWNHKWWYLLSILVCLMIASFHLYKTPKTFSRTEKVIVDESSQNSMMRDLTSFAGTTGTRRITGTNVDNEIEALASPDLMERVVERLGLQTSYIDNQLFRVREMYRNTPIEMIRLGESGTSSFSFNIAKGSDSTFVIKDFTVAGNDMKLDKIVGTLGDSIVTPVGAIKIVPTSNYGKWKNDITVSWVNAARKAKSYCGRLSVGLSGKQSSVVALSMQDVFPPRAELVLGTLLDIYNEEWIDNRNASVQATSVFINDRLQVIERELGGIENELKSYKQTHQITSIQQSGSALSQESTQVANQAFQANNQLAIARMIRDFMNDPVHSKDLLPANSGLDNANIASQINEYNKTLLERDRALSLSSESNPLVQDLNNTLERLKNAINRSIDNLISTLQLEVNQIEGREREILSRVSNTSGQEMELLSIERQQKVKEQLYIFLLQKREENELQRQLTVANTRLIMRPNGSGTPIAPNKMMIILVALVLGFGIPFAIFYIMKVLDTTVKSRSDLSRLSVPFLAELPQLGLTKNYWQRLRVDRFDKANTRVLVQPGKRDSVNEAFRVLRTNLDLMIHSSGKAQTIMVTSFNPNAGKTFTLLNLSASMALKGSKVAVVDMDLRKATLSKAVGKNHTGVASYLNGKSEDPLSHMEKLADNLDLLPVGSLPPNPAELLVSERFTMLLNTLKENYDYVFMDCPPVDLIADTSIIAPNADITGFIIRAGLFDKRALPAVEDMYKEIFITKNRGDEIDGDMRSSNRVGSFIVEAQSLDELKDKTENSFKRIKIMDVIGNNQIINILPPPVRVVWLIYSQGRSIGYHLCEPQCSHSFEERRAA